MKGEMIIEMKMKLLIFVGLIIIVYMIIMTILRRLGKPTQFRRTVEVIFCCCALFAAFVCFWNDKNYERYYFIFPSLVVAVDIVRFFTGQNN